MLQVKKFIVVISRDAKVQRLVEIKKYINQQQLWKKVQEKFYQACDFFP